MDRGSFRDIIRRRVAAVDLTTLQLDARRVELALSRHLGALGLPPRPVRWCDGLPEALSVIVQRSDAAWDAAWGAAWDAAVREGVLWGGSEGGALRGALLAAFDVTLGAHQYVSLPWGTLGHFLALPFAIPHRFLAFAEPFIDAYEAGLGLFVIGASRIIAIPRPVLRTDGDRLHSASGPAVEWRDGRRFWFWHGTRVPEWVVSHPEAITLAAIDAEPNTEVQRVMIERFGWDRFAAEARSYILDHDPRWGTLCQRGGHRLGREPVLYLKVTNRSPEPDGTFRCYALPVHPQLRPLPDPDRGETWFGEPQALTALNAVASTFGMYGAEYAARLRAES